MLFQLLRVILKPVKKLEAFLHKRRLESTDWKNVILVYQPGKVGSTSICNALNAQYDGPVIHLHIMKEEHRRKLKSPRIGDETRQRLLSDYQSAFAPVKQLGKSSKIKIITLTRDPLSRNLSAFYQNLDQIDKAKFDGAPFTQESLWELYMKSEKSTFILNWFDRELFLNFGIDVYARPFPNCGYVRLENEKADVLLMKHDLDDSEKSQLIREFTGLSNFNLERRSNVGAQKWYKNDYELAKKTGFPNWYIDKMLNSKYTEHFYLRDIPELRKRWTAK